MTIGPTKYRKLHNEVIHIATRYVTIDEYSIVTGFIVQFYVLWLHSTNHYHKQISVLIHVAWQRLPKAYVPLLPGSWPRMVTTIWRQPHTLACILAAVGTCRGPHRKHRITCCYLALPWQRAFLLALQFLLWASTRMPQYVVQFTWFVTNIESRKMRMVSVLVHTN
jgi:hypothetical protein